MKKRILISLFALLAVALLLGSCGGESGQGTTTAPFDCHITWTVNGESTVSVCSSGEVPVYSGETPYRAATETTGYRFAGWDKALAPAAGDTVYTAVFEEVPSYAITWSIAETDTVTYVSQGEVPVFAGSTDRESSAQFSYTFTGWDSTPIAATEPATYSAKYKLTVNRYQIVFRSEGKILDTKTLNYGNKIPYETVQPPIKDGYTFVGWEPVVRSVTGDLTVNARFAEASSESIPVLPSSDLLFQALDASPIVYRIEAGKADVVMDGSTTLLYLLILEHYNPGFLQMQIRDKALEHFTNLLAGGNEPDMGFATSAGGPQFSFPNMAFAIALAKKTPSVWSALSAADVEKMDLLMRCFAYASAFQMNDCNNYTTALCMQGNFGKTWNPNYIFANLGPILAARMYFGSAAKVDEILLGFDYDAVMAELQTANFTNILHTFGKAGKTLMQEGGVASVGTKTYGSGKGVKQAFLYKGMNLDQLDRIVVELLTYNYSGGSVVDAFLNTDGTKAAYTYSGKSSPVLGLNGMMLELKSGDGSGIRSSVTYCRLDLNLSVCMLSALIAGGELDPLTDLGIELRNKVYVGNTDVIFKLRQGYVNFAHGKQETKPEYMSGYGSIYHITAIWEEWLSKTLFAYRETGDYTVEYLVDGKKTTRLFDGASVVLDGAELPSGYVWYDGTRNYYLAGEAYTFPAKGLLTLTAVPGLGVESGAYLIGSPSKTVTLPQNPTDNASFNFAPGDLFKGKLLIEMLLSVPDGAAMPDTFNIQYKHKNAPNPATTLVTVTNGKIVTAENPDGYDFDRTGTRVAVAYDTQSGLNTVYLFDTAEGAYRLISSFVTENTEGTAGRPLYLYIPMSGNDTSAAPKVVSISANVYYGMRCPISAPVLISLRLRNGDKTELLSYQAGATALPAAPADPPAGKMFVGWADQDGKILTAIPADAFGLLELTAVWVEGEVVLPSVYFAQRNQPIADTLLMSEPGAPLSGWVLSEIKLLPNRDRAFPEHLEIVYNATGLSDGRVLVTVEKSKVLAGDTDKTLVTTVNTDVKEDFSFATQFAVAYNATTGEVRVFRYDKTSDTYTLAAEYTDAAPAGEATRYIGMRILKSMNTGVSANYTVHFSAKVYSGLNQPLNTVAE